MAMAKEDSCEQTEDYYCSTSSWEEFVGQAAHSHSISFDKNSFSSHCHLFLVCIRWLWQTAHWQRSRRFSTSTSQTPWLVTAGRAEVDAGTYCSGREHSYTNAANRIPSSAKRRAISL